jgi:hypothetical protein
MDAQSFHRDRRGQNDDDLRQRSPGKKPGEQSHENLPVKVALRVVEILFFLP